MDSRRFEEVRRLFQRAVELPEAKRASFLAEACAGDDVLLHEVESLLHADDDPEDLLSGSAMEALALPGAAPVVGRRIGVWEIRQELGVGGMGAVYLAERADGQFEQRVALKLIRSGLDSESVLRRFHEERRILAQLDHANIARLLDGGVTEDGVPYFTMEYVDGDPIDKYCDRGRLSIEERLELFRTVCAAVQHAHRNLVVHRDLKPSNILVSATGEVKLLDFGIAKVLGQDGADPATTRTGLRAMTPAYASPEQVAGEPMTTASDVYSLGVVLYELLCGRRPYSVDDATPAALERSIRTTQPERPSRALDRPPTEQPSTDAVAKARGASPGHVRRLLRGDLDNICLTALRKEPERRYGSAEALAEDLRRVLRGQPVTARPDTAAYRVQKFVGRNRVAVAGVAFVFVLIAALIGFYTGRLAEERDVALREARKAARVSEFLASLFQTSDPRESGGENLTARQMLDRGAARVEHDLRNEPEVLAGMEGVIGDVYRSLGLYDEARPWLEKSLRLNLEHVGEDDLATADSRFKLGVLTYETGEANAARAEVRRVLEVQRRHLAPGDPQLAITLNDLGWILSEVDSLDAAEASLMEALRIREAVFGPDDPAVAETLTNLGAIAYNRGELDDALEKYQRALIVRRSALGPEHALTGYSLQNLGTVFEVRAQVDSADAYYRQAITVLEQALGPDHPERAVGLENLARLL
ncbi:MAG TPA: serine/threonine-protein kinase, partial [bacterium]|nr:serine/threonine-protein kinase [bacterium]